MRPQHITAENGATARPEPEPLRASMRPQHITAENGGCAVQSALADVASMRPQHITAENGEFPLGSGRPGGCFNEAAAYHCGKPVR